MKKILKYAQVQEAAWWRQVENSPKATIAYWIGWSHVIKDGLGHEPMYFDRARRKHMRRIPPPGGYENLVAKTLRHLPPLD